MSGNQRGPEHGDTALAGLFAVDPTAVKIGKEIGKGAFSVVYAGEYNKKRVAVKCQPKDEHGNIPPFVLKEVKILQKLRHPNILEFIGAADHRKTRQILILSEHSNNGDLDQLLKNMRQGKTNHVGWHQIVRVALDIASGVAFLHGSGMIHRDIKSSNILLDESLCAKLCDFGFATETKWWYEHQQAAADSEQHPEKPAGVPRRKSYCGTDAYMAPEMFLDEDYNENVDVFSFGVVLMELLCCRQANKDGFLMRLPQYKFQIQEQEFFDALPESCPSQLARLATKCVSFEPSERPSIAHVVTELQAIVGLKEVIDAVGPVELRAYIPTQQCDAVECEPQLEEDDGEDDDADDDDNEDEDYRDDDSGADTMELEDEEDAHEVVTPPPFHTGTLLKRNRRGNRGWSEKIFVLDRDQLNYTDAPTKTQPQSGKTSLSRRPSQPSAPTTSSLCLKDCRIWKTMEMPELCFNIVNGNWKIIRELRALNREDLEQWMELINHAIDFASDRHHPVAKAPVATKTKRPSSKSKGASFNNGGSGHSDASNGSGSGSRERRCSRGKAKFGEERRPESAGKKVEEVVLEDTYEDHDDEVYQWLHQLGLERYTATFKAKGFASVDFVRETGIETDDLNFLGIRDPAARKSLMQAARTLRGED